MDLLERCATEEAGSLSIEVHHTAAGWRWLYGHLQRGEYMASWVDGSNEVKVPSPSTPNTLWSFISGCHFIILIRISLSQAMREGENTSFCSDLPVDLKAELDNRHEKGEGTGLGIETWVLVPPLPSLPGWPRVSHLKQVLTKEGHLMVSKVSPSSTFYYPEGLEGIVWQNYVIDPLFEMCC